jgi:hypothetical protein
VFSGTWVGRPVAAMLVQVAVPGHEEVEGAAGGWLRLAARRCRLYGAASGRRIRRASAAVVCGGSAVSGDLDFSSSFLSFCFDKSQTPRHCILYTT